MGVKLRTQPDPKSPQIARGTVIALRYAVEMKLGRGGIGNVYLASDLHAGGRAVAVKILRTDRADVDPETTFRTEYSVLSRLRHPHVEAVIDFGRDPIRGLYIAKEYLPGTDLIRATDGLPLTESLNLAAQVFRALAFLHARGLVHNDVKPENVIVVKDAAAERGRRAVIIDFGTAGPAATAGPGAPPGKIVGTLGYLAPERLRGGVPTARSDLYAAGILLYRLVAREYPFDASSSASDLMKWHLETEPARLSARHDGVPRAIDDIVARLLEKEPARRFASGHDVLAALAQIVGESAELETEATQESYVRSVPLVGRDEELLEISAMIDRALAGRREEGESAVCLITGGPGMGKSRLMAEVLVRSRLAGGHVFTGSGRKLGGALGPVRTPLRRLLSEEEYENAFATLEGEGKDRGEVLRELGDLLLARGTGVVLAIEDVHNTDELTLDLLRYLAERLAEAPSSRLACLLTSRPAEDETTQAFHGELARGLAQVNPLGPLSVDETRTFVENAIGQQVNEGFAEALHGRTDGEPLAIQEALKLLASMGLIGGQAGAGGPLSLEVLPEGIVPILTARLALLTPEARSVVRVLALMNRAVPLPLIASAADLPQELAFSVCSDLARRDLVLTRVVQAELQYLLAHDRMIQAALENTTDEELRQRHARIATALESLPSKVTDEWTVDLAHHAIQSREPDRAVMHGLRVARRLEEMFSWDQAIQVYEALLGVPDLPASAQVDALVRLGGVHYQTGDYRKALTRLSQGNRKASLLGHDRARARALGIAASISNQQGHRRKAEIRSLKALRLHQRLGNQSGIAGVKSFMAHFLYQDRQWDRARKLLEESRRIYQTLGHKQGIAETLANEGIILWKQGDLDQACDRYREAFKVGGLVTALGNLATARFQLGDLDEANKVFGKAMRLAKKTPRARDDAELELGLGLMRSEEGKLRQARKHLQTALEIYARLGDRATEATVRAALSELMVEMGRYEDASRLVADGRSLIRRQPKARAAGALAALRRQAAWQSYLRGDLEAAERRAKRAAHTDDRWQEPRALGLDRMLLASIALERGDRGRFLEEITAARATFGRIHSRWGLLASDYQLARGELFWGSLREARAMFESCAASAKKQGIKLLEARAAADASRADQKLGQLEQAERMVAGALPFARSEGAMALETELRLTLVEVLLDYGDFHQASQELKKCEAAARDPRNIHLAQRCLSMRSRILAKLGHHRDALAQIASVAQGVRNLGTARLLFEAETALAEIAREAGESNIAAAAERRLREQAKLTGFRVREPVK
ncbi:MAG: tetratricopeptide repeat protein [Acidobacteriota bacterium]